MTDCTICLTEHASINCARCSKGCCRDCGETYLQTLITLCCPSCRQPWDYEFLMTNFRPSFMSTIFKQREMALLFDQERVMFAETAQDRKYEQVRVLLKYHDHKMRIPKKVILTKDDLNFLFQGIIEQNHDDSWGYRYYTYHTRLKEISKNMHEQMVDVYVAITVSDRSNMSPDKLQAFRDSLLSVYNELVEPFDGEVIVDVEEKPRVRPCPNRGCLGFITCEGGESPCRICQTISCNRCEEVFEEGHVCKPEVVASIQRIRNDSKPCPKCHVPIHKSFGCNMMYCTLCKTRFDWATGAIWNASDWFHNPEEQAEHQQQGEQRDIPNACGFSKAVTGHRSYQHYMHIQNLIQRREHLVAAGNIDLRILYLHKVITEDTFKEQIYRRWKTHALYQVEIDILRGLQSRLLEHFLKYGKVRETEMGLIYKNVNDALRKIAHKTSQQPLSISVKDGFNEKNTFWTCRDTLPQIKNVLYSQWYFH